MLNALYLLLFSFMVWGHNLQANSANAESGKILFVVSNADHYGDSDITTANHFAELVFPYDVLIKAGYEVDFVSPNGGAVPLGYFDTSNPLIKDYIYDCTFMSKLETTKAPNEVDPEAYQAIYFGGGGAAMFGIAENEAIQEIAMHIYEKNNGVVSAVCHGSYGIANLKLSDDSYLVADKKVNGFPDIFENKNARYFQTFDNSVEGLLRKRGAAFSYSEEGWDAYYQSDGRLITGQDPSSAKKVAELIVEQLKLIRKADKI